MGTRLPGGAPANHTRIKYSITRSNCHLRLALSLSGIHNISKKKFFPKSLIFVLSQHNICTYVSTYKEMAVCVTYVKLGKIAHTHTHTSTFTNTNTTLQPFLVQWGHTPSTEQVCMQVRRHTHTDRHSKVLLTGKVPPPIRGGGDSHLCSTLSLY